MTNVKSQDGTLIAYTRRGSGPPLVQVDGALCYRDQGPSDDLADQLADHFTVYSYDRRGRGESGDTAPYTVEKETEDLAAVIEEAGGSAHVYGSSSGAVLALEAAHRQVGVEKLALYEAPMVVDDSREPLAEDWTDQLEVHLAAGRRAAAVRHFMRAVGVPGPATYLMSLMPAWKKLTGVAHTLPYDFAVLGDTQWGKALPPERWAGVVAPTLVMAGGKSPTWMKNAQLALAEILPSSRHRILDGQTHMLKAEAVAPVLVDFFLS